MRVVSVGIILPSTETEFKRIDRKNNLLKHTPPKLLTSQMKGTGNPFPFRLNEVENLLILTPLIIFFLPKAGKGELRGI